MTAKEITVAIKLKDLLSAQLLKVNKGMKGFASRMKALTSHWRAFAIAGTAATAATVAFTAKAIQAANQQESAEAKLKVLLANVRDERDKTIDSLKAQAEALQKVTKFEDAEILNAQAMLASFQLTKIQIAEITPRMLDMAASIETVSGQQANLQQISIALGKGFTGMVGQLGRYGVILSDATKKSGEFSDIIRDLDMNFKGAAVAAGKTFGGRLVILKNQFGEVQEEIGKVITKNETLTKTMVLVSNAFSKMADWVKDHSQEMTIAVSEFVVTSVEIFASFIKGLSEVGLAFGALVTGTRKFSVAIKVLIAGFKDVTLSQEDLNKMLKEGTADIVAQEDAMIKSYNAMQNLGDHIRSLIPALAKTIGKTVKFAGALGGPEQPNIKKGADDAAAAVKKLTAGLRGLGEIGIELSHVPVPDFPGKTTEAFLDLTDTIESGTSQFVGSFLGEMDAMSDLAKYHFTDIAEQFAQMIGKMIIQALALKAVKMIFGGPAGFFMGEGGIIGRPEGIPAQEGLMVYGPTRVIAGERGPEVIFPLKKMQDLIRTEFQASGGGGGGITINVYANDVQSVADSFRGGTLGRALKQVTGEGYRIVNTRGIGT